MMRRIFTQRNLLQTSVLAAGSLGIYNAGSTPQKKSSFHMSTEKPDDGTVKCMKAIQVDAFGDECQLKLMNMSIPVPKEDEVLIKVESIGVNPVEVMIRKGFFGDMIKTPYVPGTDVAGVIEEVGCKVKKLKKGDRVYSIKSNSGAYAQYCTAPASYVSGLNKCLSFNQGAAIGVPYTAAYKSLFIRAHAKRGETVLIHGASGAVGQAAIQMAKSKGLTVIGTAGTPKGMELIKCQGADYVFNHREDGYMDKVKEATCGKGVNVILEMMPSKNLVPDLGVIASRGRIVIIGSTGSIPNFDPSLTMPVEAEIMGMVIQVSTPAEYQEMLCNINQGQGSWLKPYIAREYTLEQTRQAHKDLSNTDGSRGKLIIKPK